MSICIVALCLRKLPVSYSADDWVCFKFFLYSEGYVKGPTNAVQLRLLDVYALQIQKRMEEMAGAGLDTTSLDDEAFSVEAAQDRCILRLIASCCNGELYGEVQTGFMLFIC